MRTRTPETTVLGLFSGITEAAKALKTLQDAQRKPEDLMVLSGVPFPEGVLESDHSKSRLPIITLIFAFVGIGMGILLAGGTSALYVLRQGGKPVLPGPPIGIIAYEVMMLMALTAAFAAALYEMRLPNWQVKVYDPRISEGLIGIAARCETEYEIEQAETAMRASGAEDITRDARRFQ